MKNFQNILCMVKPMVNPNYFMVKKGSEIKVEPTKFKDGYYNISFKNVDDDLVVIVIWHEQLAELKLSINHKHSRYGNNLPLSYW